MRRTLVFATAAAVATLLAAGSGPATGRSGGNGRIVLQRGPAGDGNTSSLYLVNPTARGSSG